MKAQEFIDKYYPYALQVEKETGISAIAMLAQSAGESGWKEAEGNMMFGIKDTDGLNGNEQLITTTEYFATDDVKLPYIYWIKKVKKGNTYVYKYKCKDYFRKYATPYESFKDYAIFVKTNPRY
jgi:flagellar protein FlgJ